MDRVQAIRLVDKLQALAADRAATEAEKAVARAKADALSARFRLGVEEQRRRPGRQGSRRYRARRVWVGSPSPGWAFDASTGKGSPKVKDEVEQYWGDWNVIVEIGWWRRGVSWSAFASGGSPVRRW